MFDFWDHLLTHTDVLAGVTDPPKYDIGQKPGDFDPEILIYPKDVVAVKATKKSAAGLDGLTVIDLENINVRARAKLYSLFSAGFQTSYLTHTPYLSL